MSDRFSRRSAIDRLLLVATTPFASAVLGAAAPRSASNAPAKPKVAPTLVGYVDVAVGRAKHCSACEHFVPGRAGAAKGSCTRVGGPIAPSGHCEIWAPRDHD